jgi:murein DD-endopeptidase MepM/ murein hydrolase activator NlpD
VRPQRIFASGLVLISTLGSGLQDDQLRSPRPTRSEAQVVRWEPDQLVNGSPCLFRVRPSVPLKSLTGTWMEHEVFFDFDPARRTWFGLAGVSIETKPGSYPLVLEGVTTKGSKTMIRHTVRVVRTKYPTIALRVSEEFTAPDSQTLARVEQEQELKTKVFSVLSPEREWSGRFTVPVSSSVSGAFGTRRKFNGLIESVHQGLDYRAQPGTPVSAANRGTVLLARDLFFEGNCVVLDHGQGLLTLYMHLSEIKVHEGDKVARGQEIGLSGATGRATGPHLHMAVRWQGVYVNPVVMLKLNLP